MKCFRTLLLLALVAAGQSAGAQPAAKKSLTQSDYDIWRSIQGATLSNDGQWAMYTIQPLVGDRKSVV